jgi:hypothetical protein
MLQNEFSQYYTVPFFQHFIDIWPGNQLSDFPQRSLQSLEQGGIDKTL